MPSLISSRTSKSSRYRHFMAIGLMLVGLVFNSHAQENSGVITKVSVTVDKVTVDGSTFNGIDNIEVLLNDMKVATGRNVKAGDTLGGNLPNGFSFRFDDPVEVTVVLTGVNATGNSTPQQGSLSLGIDVSAEASQGTVSGSGKTIGQSIWQEGWRLASQLHSADDGVASSYKYTDPIVMKKQIRITFSREATLDFEYSN